MPREMRPERRLDRAPGGGHRRPHLISNHILDSNTDVRQPARQIRVFPLSQGNGIQKLGLGHFDARGCQQSEHSLSSHNREQAIRAECSSIIAIRIFQ
jgi:hypothetical protein